MTIRCTWVAPTHHTSGRPIKAGALVGFELSMRVEGAPSFTLIAQPGPTVTSFDIDATDPGLYEFQLVAVGSNGTKSAPAAGSVTIADASALNAPTAFTVALV